MGAPRQTNDELRCKQSTLAVRCLHPYALRRFTCEDEHVLKWKLPATAQSCQPGVAEQVSEVPSLAGVAVRTHMTCQ